MEKTQSGSVRDDDKSCFRRVTSSALFFMQPAAPITCHLPLCTLPLQTAYHFQVFQYKRGEWAVFRISSSINIYLFYRSEILTLSKAMKGMNVKASKSSLILLTIGFKCHLVPTPVHFTGSYSIPTSLILPGPTTHPVWPH